MTITEYIEKLQHIAKKYPNAKVVIVERNTESDTGSITYTADVPCIGYIDSTGDFATSANLKKVDAVAL
jgi:hypothetical protein